MIDESEKLTSNDMSLFVSNAVEFTIQIIAIPKIHIKFQNQSQLH